MQRLEPYNKSKLGVILLSIVSLIGISFIPVLQVGVYAQQKNETIVTTSSFYNSTTISVGQPQNSTSAASNNNNSKDQMYIPSTVSEEAQKELRNISAGAATAPPSYPAPNDFDGWKKFRQENELVLLPRSKEVVDLYQPNITTTKLGGIPVIDIKPKNWVDNGKILVYAHGGAYTVASANSSLVDAVPTSNVTGLRVISIDYTTAPFSKWNQTTDQVISVIQALRDQQGYSLSDMAIYGNSAGGALAAGSILKMRDRGLGMPAAVVLWSPWSDITENGDTYFTLVNRPDPPYDWLLKHSANAYADPEFQKNPYVSPVYGNYSKGFPPTLIQGGTKETFLSNFIRLYQALDQAGIAVKLDIYEGMTHDFQSMYKIPESKMALSKVNTFLKEYLNY
jgi:monoterpene epsilon-lactone hydrolase